MKNERIELIVTDDDIDDIMCTALEGGILHWRLNVEVVGNYLGEYASEQIARGGSLVLYVYEDGETFELDKDKLLDGIKKWVDEGRGLDCTFRNGDKMELDCCMIDALASDSIIQYALFGEEVYG